MKLNIQKRLAADVAHVSPKRIRLDPDKIDDIKESITKADIRGLINDGTIKIIPKRGISRARANKIKRQKSKGRRRGPGSIKGATGARAPKKDMWMGKIRLQRTLLKDLKSKKMLTPLDFRLLYKKCKGGYFRNKRHLKIYLEDNKLVTKNEKIQ